MSDLPTSWESLEGEFINNDLHGDFFHAWGKPAGSDTYEVIVGVYVHNMTKYGTGAVYKIENPVQGRSFSDKLKGLIGEAEDPKPVLSTQEESAETTVTRTDISVNNPDEALEKAKQVMN